MLRSELIGIRYGFCCITDNMGTIRKWHINEYILQHTHNASPSLQEWRLFDDCTGEKRTDKSMYCQLCSVMCTCIHVYMHACMCLYVPLSCCCDCIHYFHDPVQSRISANGHVCATEVIVNRANHPDDVQMRWSFGLLCCDLTYKHTTDRCVIALNTKKWHTESSHQFPYLY